MIKLQVVMFVEFKVNFKIDQEQKLQKQYGKRNKVKFIVLDIKKDQKVLLL